MPRRTANLNLRVCLFLLTATLCAHTVAQPRVVASIAPLHSLVAAVMDGVATPQLLLQAGQTPHAFSLRPSEARALNDADLLFWIGQQLEMPLQRLLPGLSTDKVVAMLDIPDIERLALRRLHGDPHARLTKHGSVDPHIWLSPRNAMVMNDRIAQTLSDADPANAPRYRANASLQASRLARLDEQLQAQLGSTNGQFAVYHDAYRYFEHAYGLQPAAVVTTHPERSPGAAHLRELRQTLEKGRVGCLLSEPQFDARLVARLGEGLDLRHAVLDPLGSGIPPGPGAYFRLMHDIADTLDGCLRGETRP